MFIVEIEPDEREVLLEVIENRLRELGPEIHRCHVADFREGLVREDKVLRRLADRFRPVPVEVVA